ncbi:MAG: hypothetical protein PHT41_02625 [Candidatus Omnitrophica bacterium]|nr:hypothetical protein [Candidatus Omnitrophota bacterium]
MKKFIITFILSLFPLFCFAQIEAPLQFSIETDKKIYKAGENIKLKVGIENKAGSDIILIWCRNKPMISLEEDAISVELCKHSNPSIELLSVTKNIPVIKTINFDLSGFKRGLYNLKLKYNLPSLNVNFSLQPNQIIFKDSAFSNTLEIELAQSD